MSNWSYVFKFNDLLMSTWNIPVVDKLMFWFSNCFLNFVRDLTPYHSFVVNFTSVSRLLFFNRVCLMNRCKDQFIHCRIWRMNFRTTFLPWSLDNSEYLFYLDVSIITSLPLSWRNSLSLRNQSINSPLQINGLVSLW